MNWKNKLLRTFSLYAVTNVRPGDQSAAQKIDAALSGGVDVLQLRSKSLSDLELFNLGLEIRRLTERRKKLLIVNDRVDLALSLGADGVHLGQDDLPIQEARKLMGRRKMFIGISTHSLEQAITAEQSGADYIGFGPIFSTPTKPTYLPVGLDPIRMLAGRIKIPVVCIGGIDADNLASVQSAGATRVAVVRAIFAHPDPHKAAFILKEKLNHDI